MLLLRCATLNTPCSIALHNLHQEELSALAKSEAAAQSALTAATSRAEGAERRVTQLEKEADVLAQEVGLLQVCKNGVQHCGTGLLLMLM